MTNRPTAGDPTANAPRPDAPTAGCSLGAPPAAQRGESMIDLRLGDWHELGGVIQPLRIEVFVDEQKVPLDLEIDPQDPEHLHAVAVDRFGRALATGRLMRGAPGVARIGRMATAASMRSRGLGRTVLDALIESAAQRGDHEVRLHAQIAARGFYERAGFVEEGEPFDDAGIAHIEMVKRL